MARDLKPGASTGAPDEEAVGYGRPPSRTRIQEGQRRNPWGRKGRPKPQKDFLDGKIEIRIDGKVVKVTRYEAIDHFLFEAASKRNVSAAKLLEQRRQGRFAQSSQATDADTVSPEEELALLRAVERRLRKLDPERSDEDPPQGEPGTEPEPGA